MTEKALQTQILALAKRLGWTHCYHTFDSRKSQAGFPDVVLCRPGRLLFAELKRDGEHLTLPQKGWVDMLGRSAPAVEVYVWRPADFASIVDILR
jgi:hypothetical protein